MSNTSTHAELLYPGIRDAFTFSFEEHVSQYSKIFNVAKVDREIFDDMEFTGLPYFTQVNEDGTIQRQNSGEGFKTRYENKDFGMIEPISHKLLRGDLYSVANDAGKRLSRAASQSLETFAFELLLKAFVTTSTSYGDGKPMCSTDHTRKDAGTSNSNASATGITLTEANLYTALVAAQNVVDHNGILTPVGMNSRWILLVPPALTKTAVEITKSDLRSNTANNDMNYFSGGMIDVLASPYISQQQATALGLSTAYHDTTWFLVNPSENKLKLYIQEDIAIATEEDFETRQVLTRATYTAARGWSHWIGVFGSKGDGAAYSS